MNLSWMPFHIDDYHRDTGHLMALEHGAYTLLIMHYWQHNGLPDDDLSLGRISRLTPVQWKRCRPILFRFFHDNWRHKRIDTEIARAKEITEKRKRAAGVKHLKSQGANGAHAPPFADANDVQSMCTTTDTRATTFNIVHSVAKATAYPIDPRERLWAEGVDLLVDMGLPSERAKSMVGKWLRDTGGDAVGVLGAIMRAREIGTRDPIPLIAESLKPMQRGDRNGNKSAVAAADRLVEKVRGFIDDASRPIRPVLALTGK